MEDELGCTAALLHDIVKCTGWTPMGLPVKLAYLRHNSGLSHLDTVPPKDLQQAEKYRKAITISTEP